MPRSKTKQQVVQEFRTQEIEAAAIRVIAEKGLAGATMQAIAEEAGVAKGTLYLYFQNRTQLLQRAADATYPEVMKRVEAIFAQESSFADKIQALVLTLLDFVDSHRDLFRLYLAIRFAGTDFTESARLERPRISLYRTYLQRLATLLEGAIEPDPTGARNPEKLAFFISEGLNAILLHRLEETQPTAAEVEAAWVTDLLINGLKVRAPSKKPTTSASPGKS